MPIALNPKQVALLRLPEPDHFTQRIAVEMRRDMFLDMPQMTDSQLLDAVRSSYGMATYELHITRIATLVPWVKADVASGGLLRREPSIVLRLKTSTCPSLAAEDLLSVLRAQARWEY